MSKYPLSLVCASKSALMIMQEFQPEYGLSEVSSQYHHPQDLVMETGSSKACHPSLKGGRPQSTILAFWDLHPTRSHLTRQDPIAVYARPARWKSWARGGLDHATPADGLANCFREVGREPEVQPLSQH